MKYNIRKQIFQAAMERAGLDNSQYNYVDLYSILNGTEHPEEMRDIVYTYLDKYCSNGHFSRWTSFGSGIADDLDKLLQAYQEIMEEMA